MTSKLHPDRPDFDLYFAARRRVGWLLGLPHPSPLTPRTSAELVDYKPTPRLGEVLRSLRSLGLGINTWQRWTTLADHLATMLQDDDDG